MTRTRDLEDDDSPFDQFGVLKDKRSVRVPMQMRDALPDRPLTVDQMMDRFIRDDNERRLGVHVSDGIDSPFSLRRPGFRRLVGGNRQQQDAIDRQRQKVQDAYEEYSRDLQQAFRTRGTSPATTTTGAHEYSAEPQEGGPCTRDGYPGTWQEDDDGEMYCAIDSRATGNTDGKSLAQLQRDHASVMEDVYAAYAAEISQAWKTK